MKLVCNIRHTPLHSFCHIRRLQFLCWVFEHPKSMRRKWIEICKVLFTLFLQTFYVKLPIGFPVTNCTPITSLNIFDQLQCSYTIGIKMIGIFFGIKYANNALNAWNLCWIFKICIKNDKNLYRCSFLLISYCTMWKWISSILSTNTNIKSISMHWKNVKNYLTPQCSHIKYFYHSIWRNIPYSC